MNVDKAYKAAKAADNLLSNITMVICLLLFLFASYSLIDNYMIFNDAQDKSMLRYKPSDGSTVALSEIKDAVAWISFDNTTIDYPVMQGRDNNEYLNKNPFGEFALAGSIFLDYRNSSDFSDYYSIVYGHHMEHDAMFGALDQYKDQEYFDTHRDGTLYVGDKKYPLHIFAVVSCMASDQNIFDPYQFDLSSGFLEQNAMFFEDPGEQQHFIAFTTCAATPSEARLAVLAIISEED